MERAFPWFAWLDGPDVVLQLLREGKSDVEGKSRDRLRRGIWNYGGFFSRQVVTGMTAFQRSDGRCALNSSAPYCSVAACWDATRRSFRCLRDRWR